jgi:hypothetical protein
VALYQIAMTPIDLSRTLALVFLCCSITKPSQTQTSTQVPFAGCYRIVSQVWHPTNEDDVPIPIRFELSGEPARPPHSGSYEMRSVPPSNDPTEKRWIWRPRGDQLWLVWDADLGGFRGTLKQSGAGELAGKVTEYCNTQCEWKRRVAKVTIRQVDCTAAAVR